MKFQSALKHLILLAVIIAMGGCIQTRPIPGYARVGDEVVIGLGGIHRNASSNYNLDLSSLTAQLTDANDNVFNLPVLNVFKAYPDYLSILNYQAMRQDDFIGFDGGWFAVVRIVDDVPDDEFDVALGSANIAIASAELTQTDFNFEGSYGNQPIEILAGQSDPDSNFGQQFTYYINAEHMVIGPDDMQALSSLTVGGAHLQIDYSDETLIGDKPMVLPLGHHPHLQVAQSKKSHGDGTGSIFVTILNHHGFVSTASRTGFQGSLEDLMMGLQFYTNGGLTDQLKASLSINTANSYYIDIDGNKIEGIEALFL